MIIHLKGSALQYLICGMICGVLITVNNIIMSQPRSYDDSSHHPQPRHLDDDHNGVDSGRGSEDGQCDVEVLKAMQGKVSI